MFARFKDMFFRYRYYGYSQDILLLYKEELYRYNQLLIFGLSRQVARVSVLLALISIFVPVMRWALPLLFPSFSAALSPISSAETVPAVEFYGLLMACAGCFMPSSLR